MDDWEDDLLALAEAPVVKKKKKDKKKRKRESSGSGSDMELAGSGSDMDIQQSDSDADDAGAGNDADEDEVRPDMFPLEGLYKDGQDRANLLAMNEMDREMVLEERREKLQKYQDRQLLKRMVADQDGAGSSDADARPSRRRAPATKRAKQLEELKQKRKSKTEREERRAKKRAEEGSDYDSEAENRAHRAPSVPTFTDSEEDGEYDSDSKPVAAKKKGKSKEPAGLSDIVKICLPRKHLAVAWPCSYFSELVEGAFVRMGVGQDKGEPIYRLARVVKVSEAKTSRLYRLEKHHTDVKLMLAIGNDKRDMSMEMTSNSVPTEREWNRYLAELNQAKLPVPTMQEVDSKLETIKKYQDYALTEADINVILAKKKERANGDLHERHTLRNERDIAIRAGDATEVARIDAILARMDAGSSQSVVRPVNGSSNGTTTPNTQSKGPMTLEERRRNLAMNSIAVGTPKAVAGKTASPAVSVPGSGANTPQRQAPLTSVSSVQEVKAPEERKVQNNDTTKQNKFQKMLASKVDIDLGDF